MNILLATATNVATDAQIWHHLLDPPPPPLSWQIVCLVLIAIVGITYDFISKKRQR